LPFGDHVRKVTSSAWSGRLILVLSLAILFLAVALVRGLPWPDRLSGP
jgi:hypothetical protein